MRVFVWPGDTARRGRESSLDEAFHVAYL